MAQNNHHTRIEKLLLEAARTFNSALDYEELMTLVLRLVITAVDCEAALVFRVDHKRDDVKIRLMKADDDTFTTHHREIQQSVAGYAASFKEAIIVNDAPNDPRVDPGLMGESGIGVRSLLVVPLIGKGHMIGVVEAINKVEGDFTESDLDVLTGLNNQMAVAIDNGHLMRKLKREALERELLYEVGKKLSGSLDLSAVLRDILQSLKRVVKYDVGGIFLISPDSKTIDSLYVEGYDQSVDDRLHLKVGQGLIGHVATSTDGIIVPDVSKDDRYVSANDATRSEIVVPIHVDNRVIGVLNLESNELNAFDEHSLALLTAFATHAAISLERARLHESMMEARKLEEQVNVARSIQQWFLPEHPPSIPEYDVFACNVSSGQVGGDYYDFIRIVESQHGITIADVSGKGVPAALIMASFRASLIAEIRNNYSIRTICQKVNTLLVESLEPGNFVTGVYGVLDSSNNIFTYANCGHNLPFILRATDEVVMLGEGGPVLGVSPSALFEEQALFVHKGDMIVLYTDGVTEVFDRNDQEYGLERLIQLVRKNRTASAKDIQHEIYRAVQAFAGPEHVFDDFTVMIIKRLA